MTQPIRGSNVVLKDELYGVLRAIALTNAAAARGSVASEGYSDGFRACLAAVGVAFGLDVSDLVNFGGRHD